MTVRSTAELVELRSIKPREIRPVDQTPPSKSEQLYSETMLRTGSPRKQKSLTNVWKALEHLREVKSHEFTFANVGRTIKAMKLEGGPEAQSIRNEEGRDYKEIIRAYSAEYGGPQGKKSEYSESDEFLFGIQDLHTRVKVREALANSRSKVRRIDLLKNFISKLSPVELNPVGSFAPPVVKELTESAVHNEFNPMEINSVVSFLKAIEESGEGMSLRFDPASGALFWKEGAVEAAGPGFLYALLKIVKKES